MKMLMKKLAVLLPITLSLVACGQLQNSEKKPVDPSLNSSTSFSLLSADDFKNQCTQKSGIISGSTCIFISTSKSYAAGQSVSLAEYSIATLPSGAALLVQFESAVSNIEMYLNNGQISPPSSPRTTNGGELKFRVSPGVYPAMRVYIYECRSQSWQLARCPYSAL